LPNLSRIGAGVPTQDRSESPDFRICRTFFEIFNTRSDHFPDVGKHKDEYRWSSPGTGERQDTPGGGLGPPPYKNKFLNFHQYYQKYVKIKPLTTGDRVGWVVGGFVSSAEREPWGSGGVAPRKEPPAGCLAVAIVQLVLQNYRILRMDMACDSIACCCINRRRLPAEFAEYTLGVCAYVGAGYTCVYPAPCDVGPRERKCFCVRLPLPAPPRRWCALAGRRPVPGRKPGIKGYMRIQLVFYYSLELPYIP
jgi:hypothetical protein